MKATSSKEGHLKYFMQDANMANLCENEFQRCSQTIPERLSFFICQEIRQCNCRNSIHFLNILSFSSWPSSGKEKKLHRKKQWSSIMIGQAVENWPPLNECMFCIWNNFMLFDDADDFNRDILPIWCAKEYVDNDKKMILRKSNCVVSNCCGWGCKKYFN